MCPTMTPGRDPPTPPTPHRLPRIPGPPSRCFHARERFRGRRVDVGGAGWRGVLRPWTAILVSFLLWAPTAAATPQPPRNLQGAYMTSTGLVDLSWDPPQNGTADFTYYVWRDGTTLLASSTSSQTFTDDPPGAVPDFGLIYLVSSAPPGNSNNIGLPAVVGVPTIQCEVVSVTTSWSDPYLTVTLHEECMKGTVIYDKTVVWQQP